MVEAVRNQMRGLSSFVSIEMNPHTLPASLSLCFMARRFGTSSPNTRVK